MDYRVVITENAEEDLDKFVKYLLTIKRNEQAAKNLLDDFEETKNKLIIIAGSLPNCHNPQLKEQGYKRIGFQKHRYFMLYRIEAKKIFVDYIFHELQDYEKYFD